MNPGPAGNWRLFMLTGLVVLLGCGVTPPAGADPASELAAADRESELGLGAYHQGDYPGALRHLNTALAIRLALRGDTHTEVATEYNNLGLVHDALLDEARALDCYEKALAIFTATLGETDPHLAATLSNLGLLYDERQQFERSMGYFQRALGIFRNAYGDTDPEVSTTYNGIALSWWRQGNYPRALEYYQRALAIELEVLGPNHPGMARTYNGLGASYQHLGDYTRALDYYRLARAIDIDNLGETHINVGIQDNNLSFLHRVLGDYARSLADGQQALAIYRANLGETHPYVATSHNSLGGAYYYLHEYDSALSQFHQALAINRESSGESHPSVATTLNNLGYVYLDREDDERALANFKLALAIDRSALGDRHPTVATLYSNIGLAHYRRENIPAAIDAFRAGLEALRVFEAPWDGRADTLRPLPATVGLLYHLSRAQEKDRRQPGPDRLRTALATAGIALEVLTRLRAGIAGEGRSFYEDNYRFLPAHVLRLQYELERADDRAVNPELAIRAADMAAAWSFMELLAQTRRGASGLLPPELELEECRLSSRLDKLNAMAGNPDADRERVAAQEQHDIFVQRLYREAPRYAAFRYPQPVLMASLRQHLGPDEAALEYVISPDGCFLALVTTEGLLLKEIGGETELTALIGEVREKRFARGGATPDVALRRLYAILLEPVESRIAGKRLLVVPSGGLEELPFEALLTPRGTYAADEWKIGYAPSLATMVLQRIWAEQARPVPARLLALGNPIYAMELADTEATRSARAYSETARDGWAPLPGTANEIRSVARYFTEPDRTILMDSAASESRLTAEDWSAYGYFHFACHGVLEAGPGREPALVLTLCGNTLPSDGFLTLSEAVRQRHQARLTVLSACNTGRAGRQAARTGVSSLARAFLLAGSEQVVVSLWEVSDVATAKLMLVFYRGMLEEGLSPGDALRRARSTLRRESRTAGPGFWAPFVMMGAGDQ